MAVKTKRGVLSIQLDKSSLNSNLTAKKPSDITKQHPLRLSQEEKNKSAKKNNIEKILVVGSRVAGRSVQELAVPVDLLSQQALINTGHSEVGRMLQAITPSFNFSSSAISDGSDALRPATLRGLGPDQTLVLVNGKRRHQASLIHINTSVGRGATGTDMNAIPANAIKRIEVLRDGAAAQYGSDAIAGVINIVLNDADQGGELALSYGQTRQGDGETINLNLNQGINFANTGFLNTSFNYRNRAFTDRSGLHGSCQFSGCEANEFGEFVTDNTREILATRKTFRLGDADSEQYALILNGGYEFDQSRLYSFMTFSERENESATFFRHNNAFANVVLNDDDATIPSGFLPIIHSDIKDKSINFGYQIDIEGDARLDLSYTLGKNTINYINRNTINSSFVNRWQHMSVMSAAEIRQAIPRSAFSYGLTLSLQTFNLDYAKEFDTFSLAMGAELRTDKYQVISGEKYAYFDYDSEQGVSLYPEDYSGGTQGFRGISPISAVNESRHVSSFYVDIESKVTDNFIVNSALRYDDYDGFNNNANYKLAASYKLNSHLSIRSAINTGFRAPSMQQLYFNNISTQFIPKEGESGIEQIPVQVGTFRNDSLLAKNIGIPNLKEESSTNYSMGAILRATNKLHLTLDYYAIDIKDRIVISNKLGLGLSTELDQALLASGAGAGQFFLNGADTKTSGVDLIATWQDSIFDGDLTLTFAANVTKTRVNNLYAPPGSSLFHIPATDIFSAQDISIIEAWQPQDRVNLTALFKRDSFSFNFALNRYGEYTITDGQQQTYGAKLLTDLRMRYQWDHALSFNFGGNNIFDVYPDKNRIGNSRSGTILDVQGNTIVDSAGVFTYSRRSAPFGFNGAYYYAGVEYRF